MRLEDFTKKESKSNNRLDYEAILSTEPMILAHIHVCMPSITFATEIRVLIGGVWTRLRPINYTDGEEDTYRVFRSENEALLWLEECMMVMLGETPRKVQTGLEAGVKKAYDRIMDSSMFSARVHKMTGSEVMQILAIQAEQDAMTLKEECPEILGEKDASADS